MRLISGLVSVHPLGFSMLFSRYGWVSVNAGRGRGRGLFFTSFLSLSFFFIFPRFASAVDQFYIFANKENGKR